MIAPSHGPSSKDPRDYLAYYEDARRRERVTEKKAVIVVRFPAYGNTAAMGEEVADGLAAGAHACCENGWRPMERIIAEIDESFDADRDPDVEQQRAAPDPDMIGTLVTLNIRGSASCSAPTAGAGSDQTVPESLRRCGSRWPRSR